MLDGDEMSKKAQNRADQLASDLPSPRIVMAIDRALQENNQERLDLLDLRKMAVRRHGDTVPVALSAEGLPQVAVEKPTASAPTNERQAFDGTVRGLIAHYQSDPDSPFQDLRYRTKENYKSLLRRIDRDIGPERIKDLDARRITRIHEAWMRDGHIAMAHSLVTMLRALMTFGSTFLKSTDCRELRTVLTGLQFEMPKPRFKRLTEEQANLIRAMPHEMGRPSIALAQAFQFDCGLGQKDVIGEWVPIAEQNLSSYLTHAGNQWLRGLRWEEISNLVLRRAGNPDREIDLRSAPMVMDELGKRGAPIPASGPVIVCEWTKRPWTTHEFRRWWRKVADAAGIPDDVKNMDSRQRTSIPEKYIAPRYRSAKRKEETEKDRPADADLQSAGRVH
jgi:hypothetical protein